MEVVEKSFSFGHGLITDSIGVSAMSCADCFVGRGRTLGSSPVTYLEILFVEPFQHLPNHFMVQVYCTPVVMEIDELVRPSPDEQKLVTVILATRKQERAKIERCL